MEYEIEVAPFNKMIIGVKGQMEPLCNNCVCPDCDNPIEERTVSCVGVPKKMKVYVAHNVIKQVVACRGYLSKKDAKIRPTQRSGADSSSPEEAE